jgi:glycosyltransferase involved in cell wall biosynthesis
VSRPLAVALLTNLYPPYVVGGYEILAREVADALRARGHVVHVLTGRGRLLRDDGFTHPAFDLDLDRKEQVFLGGLAPTLARAIRWHLFHPPTYRRVRRVLGLLRPDVSVAWNLYGASLAPLIAASRSPAVSVAQPADRWLLHGLTDPVAAAPGLEGPGRLAFRLLCRALRPAVGRLAAPRRLFAVSDFIRGLHLGAGFPAERTATIHLGVDVGCFPVAPPRPAGARPWRLAFAGQLWEGKGPQVAVEALALLRERGRVPAPALEIFGTGTAGFEAMLDERARSLGVAAAVRRHGFVPREQLGAALGACDAFLFCSTWDEPFSRGLLEAMACGLPTVATTTGGTPEAVAHEENGLLVPPGDAPALARAVERLILEPQLAERLGRAAAEDVRKRWSFDDYVGRLERAWTAAAGEERRKPGAG